MDWFLYDKKFRQERVNVDFDQILLNILHLNPPA